MRKRFNEYFAKVILENCFPNKFQNIEVSDKPDLRYNGNKIGIEVAYCMPKEVAEAFKCIDRYEKAADIPKKTLKKAEKVGVRVEKIGVVWHQDWFKEKTFESLKSINNGVRKYDVVYLRVNDQKIFVYNLKENKYEELLLYGALDKFTQRAVQLRNGET